MFCENCGKQLDEGTKFCTSCGANVSGANANATPMQTNFNQQMNYGMQQPTYNPNQQMNYGIQQPMYAPNPQQNFYNPAANAQELAYKRSTIEKIRKSEKVLGILLIIFGILQPIAGIYMLSSEMYDGFWNILAVGAIIEGIASLIYGLGSVKHSENIYIGNQEIVGIYEYRLPTLIFLMVCDCLFGGIIGIVLSILSCQNRNKILNNRNIFFENISQG